MIYSFAMNTTLIISEIFYSLQGESTHAGEPFVFIRLAGCNLRCKYCDTRFAWFRENGTPMSFERILGSVEKYAPIKKILITGGEPLLQKPAKAFIKLLDKKGYTVLVETNGSLNIAGLPKRVVAVMDIKTPSSGHIHDNDVSNLKRLKKTDELKFVIADKPDYLWTKDFLKKYRPNSTILLAPVQDRLKLKLLAKWMLQDKIDAHLQPRLHKIIGLK